MNGAELIARILEKEGIEIIPCYPYNPVIEEGAKIGLRPIVVRQERQALHIADGYARVTGGKKICATAVQTGPGSENAFGGVAQCFGDNVPLLHLPGGYMFRELMVRPNFNASRSMQHINKHCEMAMNAEHLPQMLQNAFAMIRNGRPGPVTIELPDDVFEQDVEDALLDTYCPQRRSAPVANPSDVKELAEALLKAQAPVIVAGQGILYADACEELKTLAELTQTPVMTTLNGKSAFPENHPLSLGCGGRARPDQLVHFLNKADVILGLGTSFTRSDYITPLPEKGKTFLQLTNWEGDISKDYSVDYAAIGDAKPSIAALVEEIKDRAVLPDRMNGKETIEELATAREAFMEKWLPVLTSDEVPITPYRVVWDLMKVIDRTKSTVTHDAGSPREQLTTFYESITPHGYLGWGKTTQLGTGLGLVQGAKLARPDWTCVNFMGDASIGMVMADIETGVRCNIGTTSIVFRNNIMGNYSDYLPVSSERYDLNKVGGDYAGVAESLGAHAERVSTPDAIVPALRSAFAKNAEGMPAIVEVMTREEKRAAKLLPDGCSVS
ncbi:MAG: thiamine pyrophosphate-requiring protein [Pseudomonadota bacterium]